MMMVAGYLITFHSVQVSYSNPHTRHAILFNMLFIAAFSLYGDNYAVPPPPPSLVFSTTEPSELLRMQTTLCTLITLPH